MRQKIVMASSSAKKSRIVAAINSLGDDGVIVSPLDYNKFEALIGDNFDESDESGCEDELECGNLIYETTRITHFLLPQKILG